MAGFPAELEAYIAPGCDRLAFLQAYLAARGVRTSVVPVNGRRHLYVNFPAAAYDPTFKIKTVITHYDRVPGSPGANDNSVCDLAVAEFAVRLGHVSVRGGRHNVRIFFTDGEELGAGGVSEQGAFGLAERFRALGITHDDVYVFDSCGRGTVPVLARAGVDANVRGAFKKQFASLYERTQNLLRDVSPQRWMSLPVPYSDNAGFLACGIPAVAITFLPADEASDYARALLHDKQLEKAVMHGGGADDPRHAQYIEKMPRTWRLFHTEHDNLSSLTAGSWDLLARILDTLGATQFLA
ncbi:MAG: Zn-dependent exopeptidase M28 [Treponemataceae bacterium]|nr:Zn-dependent exopeptidase M28 [Treponemataceae bacterium]